MASVESIERRLLAEEAAGNAPSVMGDALSEYEEQYDEDMVDAAHIHTSGMTQSHSAPSDAESEGSTETERSKKYSTNAESVYGDTAMAGSILGAFDYVPDDDGQHGEDHPMFLVEEARSLGLCRDYLMVDPLASICIPTPPETPAHDLADPPEVQSIALSVALGALNGANTHEKWDVDKESALFLSSVIALGKDDGSPLNLHDAHLSFSDIRLVEPLLRCDPELELQRLRRRNEVNVSTRGFEQFALDIDKDESLAWLPSVLDLPAQLDRSAASEKLEVGKDVMEYLRDLANPASMSYTEMMDMLIESDRAPHPRLMTPPLMPLSPPFSPAALPEEMQVMELTSSPEDLIAKEATELERQIMEIDENPEMFGATKLAKRAMGATVIDPTELYSGLKTPTNSSSSPLRRKRLPYADVPLLPQGFDESPAKKTKTVSFPEELHTLIPQPESDVSIMDPNAAQQDLDAYISDVVMPFAESALEQTESEQLVEVDTTMRVKVPRLVDSAPTPPWQLYSRTAGTGSDLDAQRALMSFTKRELLRRETSWSGVSKLERALAWSPFPARLGKVDLDEDLDDDKSSARYMAQLAYDDELDLQSLIAKTEGLRLLDAHDSDDEELGGAEFDDSDEFSAAEEALARLPYSATRVEVGEHKTMSPAEPSPASDAPARPARLDMQTLLQRRKMELEKASGTGINMQKHVQSVSSPTDNLQKSRSTSAAGLKPSRPSDLFREGGIANYLQLQGGAVKPLHHVPREAARAAQPAAPAAIMAPPPQLAELSPRETLPVPAPKLLSAKKDFQVVVSTKLLANRTLVRHIQNLLPNLELVERDAISNAQRNDKKATGQDHSTEADITMSPMCGLLVTTLQKLTQKPLPGHSSFFGIRERITAVSFAYERLVVLVSEGRQSTADSVSAPQSLDERDCEALSGLMSFVALLDTEVQVKYVPGGNHELAKWTAAAISQNSVAGIDEKLLQEETLWERFLCSAGMNACAAQVILSKLKQPESRLDSESSSTLQSSEGPCYGLPTFLRMSAEERIQHFGPVLGGDTVLNRVSQAIDGGWMASK